MAEVPEEERWAAIEEAPKYEVSIFGKVRNRKTGRLITPSPSSNKYLQVNLTNGEGTQIRRCVHRLVAIAFIPNPGDLPQVDHLTPDKTNNRVECLRWVSAKVNSDAYPKVKHKTRERAIDQLTLDGLFVKTWESTKAAAEAMKVSRCAIQACLVGRSTKSKGFLWVYHDPSKDDEEWRTTEERGVLFEVSDEGRVKLPKSGIVTFGAKTGSGGYEVQAAGVHFSVARLVAQAFVEKATEAATEVMHLNGDNADNRSINLAWRSETERLASIATRFTPVQLARVDEEEAPEGPDTPRPLVFGSIAEASRATGVPAYTISNALRGKSDSPWSAAHPLEIE